MKPKILLIGAGGHCKVVLDLLLNSKDYTVAGILDLPDRLHDQVFGVSVIGSDADLPKFFRKGIRYCFVTIGSVGDCRVRVKLYNLAQKAGFKFPNLIHSSAMVSSQVVLGEGNYIAPGVIINAGTRIGNNCIINTGAIIEHDCKLGDFVHISPGVILSGAVSIADYTHVGTGSLAIQNVKIGANTVIGAGSVITKDIPAGVIAYGSPCKEQKNA